MSKNPIKMMLALDDSLAKKIYGKPLSACKGHSTPLTIKTKDYENEKLVLKAPKELEKFMSEPQPYNIAFTKLYRDFKSMVSHVATKGVVVSVEFTD
jgi:hypothetical protein